MAVNCSSVVPSPLDVSPVRSPQRVHSYLAGYVRGRQLVELGTRNGDGIACFSLAAASATAVELVPKYCEQLKLRAARGTAPPHFNVLCRRYQAGLPDADVYTWWQQPPSFANSAVLAFLHKEQKRGAIRATAEAEKLGDAATIRNLACALAVR
ncbi:MAG: hypothetical protein SGPRY_000584 [Prymnesium sp.]